MLVSMGEITESITSCALAPGKLAVTVMVEGVILGYWVTGSTKIAIVPASRKSREMTIAKRG